MRATTMKTKTSELTGAALDWAVAKAIGKNVEYYYPLSVIRTKRHGNEFSPSTDWRRCGPLIAGFQLHVMYSPRGLRPDEPWFCHDVSESFYGAGSTPQIAICRAVVAAKLGGEVELPEGLV